jgi:hypothetical protein
LKNDFTEPFHHYSFAQPPYIENRDSHGHVTNVNPINVNEPNQHKCDHTCPSPHPILPEHIVPSMNPLPPTSSTAFLNQATPFPAASSTTHSSGPSYNTQQQIHGRYAPQNRAAMSIHSENQINTIQLPPQQHLQLSQNVSTYLTPTSIPTTDHAHVASQAALTPTNLSENGQTNVFNISNRPPFNLPLGQITSREKLLCQEIQRLRTIIANELNSRTIANEQRQFPEITQVDMFYYQCNIALMVRVYILPV